MAVDSKTLELRALKDKQYRWIDRKWDLVFWVTAAFVVGAAADITKQLFAGDWDFWTDWKDRQWWPIITPFAIIIIGSALQYIQWLAWRFPTGMTYTAVAHVPLHAGRPLAAVGRVRLLPDELRLAGDDGGGGDLRRLGTAENQELRAHLGDRLDLVRHHLVDLQLHPDWRRTSNRRSGWTVS